MRTVSFNFIALPYIFLVITIALYIRTLTAHGCVIYSVLPQIWAPRMLGPSAEKSEYLYANL